MADAAFLLIKIHALRGESRAAATSKMERFVVIVKGWKPLAFITKPSVLDVAAALDPPLHCKYIAVLLQRFQV